MSSIKNESEVARIREQIRHEYRAAQLALTGPTIGTLRHEFITKRMENVGQLQEELTKHIGDYDATMELVIADMQSAEITQSHAQG